MDLKWTNCNTTEQITRISTFHFNPKNCSFAVLFNLGLPP